MRFVSLACTFALACAVARGDDLFVDVPTNKQRTLIDRNFDYYHDKVFRALPEKHRIAKLNNDAMREEGYIVTVLFPDDSPSFDVKGLGIRPTGRGGSEYGYWSGTIESEQDIQAISALDGMLGKTIHLSVKLRYWDAADSEYKNASNILDFQRRRDGDTESAVADSLPRLSNYVFHVIDTDVNLYYPRHDLNSFNVSSLPSDPEYVIITLPDPEKNFDVFEGPVHPELAAKMRQLDEEYRAYRRQVEREQHHD